MARRASWTVLAAALAPAVAGAVTIPGFDHARPATGLEVGGGAAGGDDLISAFGLVRYGLVEELDLTIRGGFVGGLGVGADEQSGFEVGSSLRMRFLREEDTRLVDVAAIGQVGLVKTPDVFLFGADPQVVVSRHFGITEDRFIYVSAGIGLALTLFDVDGGDSDLETGLLGFASAGVDIVPQVRLSLEGRLRDDFERFGLAVTYTF